MRTWCWHLRYAVGAVLVSVAQGAAAQNDRPPDLVAQAVIDADSRRDWRAILRLAHPDALLEFKRSQLEFMEMDLDPDYRRLRAEHGQEVGSGPSRFIALMLDSVFQVHTVERFRLLSPDSVMARFLRMPGMREFVEDSARVRPARVIPGFLLDGDSVAFVVVRRPDTETPDSLSPGLNVSPAELMTLRRYRGQWRSMLDAGVVYSSLGGFAFGFSDEPD